MGSQRVYRQLKYEFGKQLFNLRARIALTQGQLAKQIGVHWHSVQKWESGESYPRSKTLQRLIAVLLRHQAFTSGNEREEAAGLWRQVRADGHGRLPDFDEGWFARILTQASQPVAASPGRNSSSVDVGTAPVSNEVAPVVPTSEFPDTIVDLGEVIAVPNLLGREQELATLQQWVVEDRCRVVAVVGLGGIGKSSLTVVFAQRALSEFDVVLFRSLQNGPPLSAVLDHTIITVSGQQAIPPEQFTDKIALLVQLLRERRCLLILDNYESIMQPGALTGTYRTGYGDYGALVRALSEREHRSCLLLTSREKPSELGRWESLHAPVRSMKLAGLADDACRLILAMKDIAASEEDMRAMSSLYHGNPLALNLVSGPIRELFGGDLATFLSTGYAYFDGVHKLMEQHFARLTPLERTIVYWFSVQRELMSLDTLLDKLGAEAPPREVLAALESLIRRGQIEHGAKPSTFTLQPMILEFVTEEIVDIIC